MLLTTLTMYTDTYDESMDEFEAALNTYRVLILEDNALDMLDEYYVLSFLVDLSDYPDISIEDRIEGGTATLKVLEVYEHYEKCADLRDYINELKNGI